MFSFPLNLYFIEKSLFTILILLFLCFFIHKAMSQRLVGFTP